MKPILFNTEMVRAIMDGRKTVTRRIIKPQPGTDQIYPLGCCVDGDRVDVGKFGFGSCECGGRILYVRIPYNAGDILYVRETWVMADDGEYYYKANEPESYKQVREALGYKWYPSIHMPKKAARIFLRVVSVHAERLQEITAEQATQEGIKPDFPPFQVGEFIDIWNSTVKKADVGRYSWLANPWVWVIEFERCEKPIEYSPW